MRARLDLLHDYGQALDPIRASGNKVALPGYSIFEEHNRGTTRSTATYLVPEALKPFWNMLGSRLPPREGEQHSQYDESYPLESLKELVRRFGYILREIQEGREQTGDTSDATKLCGTSSRLPFIEKEVLELRELCNMLNLLPLKQM